MTHRKDRTRFKECNLNTIMQQAESFKEVFVELWRNLNQTQLMSFAMTAWSIWQKRNLQLWENKTESQDKVIARTRDLFRDLSMNNNHERVFLFSLPPLK
ncbi:unnamed protein product [Trifolium pratense]|uniref:Uncharacterized protein n=1 Tax=Trifolium pratense TaxID=57577 RepID=A0ACB0KS60_TRIPR|nr:unnamed protein product [Trifolium pratense]